VLTAAGVDPAIEAYQRDGAAVLRGVLSGTWIDRMRGAIERIVAKPIFGSDFSRPGDARFIGDMFTWTHDADVEAFLTESPLPELAATVMRAKTVRIFYDQLFVKEPGAMHPTPWHQDLPYWPVRGEQVLSIWVPFDTATPENGVVTYVRGSHRWPQLYRPAPFAASGTRAAEQRAVAYAEQAYPSMPDIEGRRDEYEFLTWTLEPGDVLLHHPRTVHGAPGNSSAVNRRRALSARYIGDDARWEARPGHFMLMPQLAPLKIPQLQSGDPFGGPLFPRVWPRG
jgi:ectoine hydroxylase-related dioxygenase (phytanoyl-CoA dioxygenase family)